MLRRRLLRGMLAVLILGSTPVGLDATRALASAASDEVATAEVSTGRLSGTILATPVSGGAPAPLTGASVWIGVADSTSGYGRYATAEVDGAGRWSVDDVAPGTYVIRADHPRYVQDYYGGTSGPYSVPAVWRVTAGETRELGSIVLVPRQLSNLGSARVTGVDRFGTSVMIAREVVSTVPTAGTPVVYISNGMNYPDALAAGPAAIVNDGVVLLVHPTFIPDLVRSELARLRPQRIVVTGGPDSVSTEVYEQLASYVDDPSTDLDRITGLDRFGTSRELALDTFPTGAEVAFVATGLNYPDALTAGSPAGLLGSPILLVNGGATALDADTRGALEALDVREVVIVGGPPSVSSAIEADLREMLGTASVIRLTGSDRFGTSLAVAEFFFDEVGQTYLATGLNFPDALAGAPLAARLGSPVHLTRQGCITPQLGESILGSGAFSVVLLGGPPSLADTVVYVRC